MGWPESLDKHLVEGCLKVVQDGIYVTEYTGLFYVEVAKYIWAQTSMSISRTDLKARFEYFKGLWGRYHKLTRELARSPAGTSNEHIKKELESDKYKRMLQFEDQLAVIFIACDEYKSKPIAAYRTNIKCGNFSSTSGGKRRTDEESSRQVRQKSSEVHMPQSSQDGMTRLDNHKLKQQIQPKGVNSSWSTDTDQQSENHRSMSRGSASAAVMREQKYEQPTDYISALTNLDEHRCSASYFFFYSLALRDPVALSGFIAKKTYSSRRKYLNHLLDHHFMTLEPDKMNRWHELRVRELDAPVAPVDHACPRDSA